jgi:TfoX/Sxy family transcriptional regulator of competence genes
VLSALYAPVMAYDEKLAKRICDLMAEEPDLTQQKMFGGLAFLVAGNMAVAASGQGGLMVRVDPAEGDKLIATTHARAMEMQGRSMSGWLRLDSGDVRLKRELEKWVTLGVRYAKTLPRK